MFGVLLATMMIPVEVTIIPEYLMMLRLGWYNTYYPLIVPSMLVGSFGTFLFRGSSRTFLPPLKKQPLSTGPMPGRCFPGFSSPMPSPSALR